MLYAVGVGPLRTAEGRELARTAAAAVDVATVRDEESRDLLAAIGVDGETVARIEVSADPAFALPDAAPADDEAWRALGLDPQRPTVGVSLRHWPPVDGDPQRVVAAVA